MIPASGGMEVKVNRRVSRWSIPAFVGLLCACGGGGGAGASPNPSAPTTLAARSAETDAVVAGATVSVNRNQVTLSAPGHFTLQTTVEAHPDGNAHLRPLDGPLSPAATGPFVFWNGGRSLNWPASVSRLTWIGEGELASDATHRSLLSEVAAKFNAIGASNAAGARIVFSLGNADVPGEANCRVRVDPSDTDLVSRPGIPAWTRWEITTTGSIRSCAQIYRTPGFAREISVLAHEGLHAVGLLHTDDAVSGPTLMSAFFVLDRSTFDNMSRIVTVSLRTQFRRRPGTRLAGDTEDETSASATTGKTRVIGTW